MNKGSNNHYTLLLQDETETDGLGLEEEEEEIEDGMNVIGDEDEEEEEDEEDEPIEDSDEEEIFSSSKHRSLSHHEGANLNGQSHIGGHGNEYRLLNNNDADMKTVLEAPITIWTPTPMSPARRACFIASIMFGILVVATFLWVLPCDVQPCEGELGLRDRDWAVKIEGMGINQTKLLRRLAGGHNVLLSYYTSVNISSWDSANSSASDEEPWQSDHIQTDCNNCGLGDSEDRSVGDGHCGLLMLDGNLGRENWRARLRECPVDLQCDLLDVSGDRVPDCIVRGINSMVFMIEARYGSIVWHLHTHKDIDDSSTLSPQPTTQASHLSLKLYNPGPAVLLPDVNNDNFGELLFPGLLSSEKRHSLNQEYPKSETLNLESDLQEPASSDAYINNLVLVCGQSGSVIGSPLVLSQCHKIQSVTYDGQRISYSCTGIDGAEEGGTIRLTALLHQMGAAAPTQESETPQENSQPLSQYYPVHMGKGDPCKVAIYNQGICPQCRSEIRLIRSDGQELWHQDYEHSTVVSWTALLSDGKCHGAILKVWEWKHISTVIKTAKPPPSVNRRTTRSSLINDVAEIVETEPTYLEKDSEDEIELDISFNSSMNSESNQIADLPHDSFVMEYSRDGHANLNEDKIGPVREDSGAQPQTTLESPRVRRNFLHNSQEMIYEHPTIHHHQGKQASANLEDHVLLSENFPASQEHPAQKPEKNLNAQDIHESYHHPKQVLTTTTIPSSFPTGMRTMPPSILAPPGYQLQQIHERLAVLKTNGTIWHEETLASLGLGITQLCKNENSCIPDIESHARSVAVTPGVEKRAWQLISSSTTFVNTPINGELHHTSPWTLTSIVRKIIVYV